MAAATVQAPIEPPMPFNQEKLGGSLPASPHALGHTVVGPGLVPPEPPVKTHMGSFDPLQAQAHTGAFDPHQAQAPVTGRMRTIVRQPRPRIQGATEFYGTIPKRNATFAWSEVCATPDGSLAMSPQVPSKTWHNTYLYVPEQPSHLECQFLDRYVRGPDGEWLDVVKARRMSEYLERKRLEGMRQNMERDAVMSGSVMHATGYTDAYSGQPLLACRGQLLHREQLLEQYDANPHRFLPRARDYVNYKRQEFDFDNLRVPWPFSEQERNKKVSQDVYNWFDRQNVYIPNDRSYEMLELSSMYVDNAAFEQAGGAKSLRVSVQQRTHSVEL